MIKAPKHPEPEKTHPEPAQAKPDPIAPPIAQAMAQPQPLDATSDANMIAIIQAQLTVIQAQFTEATYLFGTLPGPADAPPANAAFQSISDTCAGMQRALGAFIAQSNSLVLLWPPPYVAGVSAVNGNGGSP